MTLAEWLGVVGVCALAAMAPGASLVVVLRWSSRSGWRAGLLTAWAHAAGIAVYAGAAVTGLATWLMQYPTTERAVNLLGAGVLAWLGITAMRGARAAGRGTAPEWPSAVSAVRDGFLTALINPKVAAFFLALFSQFVAPETGGPDKLLLVATAAGVDGLWYSLVALATARAAWQRFCERHVAGLEAVSGAVLLMLAAAGLARGLAGL